MQVAAASAGRLPRCLARVARLDIHPGDHVRVRGCLHQSTAALRGFRAEAFVA